MLFVEVLSERPAARKLRDGQTVLIRRLSASDRLETARVAQQLLDESKEKPNLDRMRANQLIQCELIKMGVLRRRLWGLLPPVPAFKGAEDALKRLSIERIGELADFVAEVNGISVEGANPNP